jgi:hypothetical protein
MTTPTPLARPVDGRQMTLLLDDRGQPSAVVLGALAEPSVNLVTTQAEAWIEAAWEAFRPLVVGTVTCTGAIVRDVSIVDGRVIELGAPANPTGSGGAASSVASAATLIKWSTGGGGRSGKGRSFIPGLSQSQVGADGRSYQAGYAATVQQAVSAYLGNPGLGSQGLLPAVLSFSKGQAQVILSGGLSGTIGVQRRRMRA